MILYMYRVCIISWVCSILRYIVCTCSSTVPTCSSAHQWGLIRGELTLVKGRSSDVMRNKREEVWCILLKPAAEVTGAGVSEEVSA
jgi:hypothetical protein